VVSSQDGESHKENTTPSPASPEGTGTHPNKNITQNKDSINERALVDRINRSDRWMIWLTAAIAFTGVVSAIIFGWQLIAMQGQLDEMKQSFAADRAYIFMSGVERSPGEDIHTGYVIKTTFKNYGRTPAIVSTVLNECRYFLTLPNPFIKYDPGSLPIYLPVAANDPLGPFPAAINATNEEIAAAREGRGSIRCLYNIIYRDVRANQHIAGACLVFGVGLKYLFYCPEEQYRDAYQKSN
jgi:hypothetical protein